MKFWVERCTPQSGKVFYFIVEAKDRDAALDTMLHAVFFNMVHNRNEGLASQGCAAKLHSGPFDTKREAERAVALARGAECFGTAVQQIFCQLKKNTG